MQRARRPTLRTPLKPPLPKRKTRRRELSITVAALAIAILLFVFLEHHYKNTRQAGSPAPNAAQAVHGGFDKTQFSRTEPGSPWVIVNKKHQLSPANYAPSDLTMPDIPLRVPGNESMQVRKITATALEQLVGDAKAQGLNFMLSSGYRSYAYQVNLYGGYVHSVGQAEADKSSARPGYSEHQTGFAADLEPTNRSCELDTCFAQTPEGQWLAANAYKYGFIIRYTKDKVAITGYEYEPWHIRYVGVPLATAMRQQGVETLEEFFGVPGGDYTP